MQSILSKSTPLTLLLLSLLMTGCSTKSYYTLGDTSNIHADANYTQSIAVEKVDIPKYLKDTTLVKQITPYQVIMIKDAHWLTPMQKRLTNVLISYLQQSLNNPNVYLYPWESNIKTTQYKVSLKITKFIAYKEEVILESSYQITNLQSKKHQTKLFSTSIPTKENTESMMESMEKAYFQLANEIKKEIIKANEVVKE